MKVFEVKEVPFTSQLMQTFDVNKELELQKEHQIQLEAWLRKNGWNGKNTGKIARFRVADGYAAYMMADGPKSVLVHLPYGDRYHYRDVEFLPKKEVLKRIEAHEKLAKFFENR